MVAVADSGLTFDLVAPLIPELEGLYRDYDESRRFLTDAGLENALEWIDRSDRAGERWYTIIRWAMEVGDRVDALLARAELEYRDNAQLVEVAARIRAVRQSRAAAPIPTGAPVVPARPRPAVLDRPARALIDRVDGIGLLESALRDVSTASGGALLLIGESGIGKTSLAERAAWLAAEMDVVVVHAQCIGPSAEPLLPIRDGLAAYRGERPVREMLAEGGPSLQPYLQFVQSLLRVEEGGSETRPLGGSRPSNVYEGLSQVLIGLGARSGLCLIVEDLTDADSHTLSFLEYLFLKSERGRVLTISTLKRDLAENRLLSVIDVWQAKGSVARYDVPPLPRENAAEFVAQLPGGRELDERRVAEIYDLARGNPYYMQQLVADTAERTAADGQWAALPRDLGAVLLRRLTLLDDPTRSFLDAASVALENTQSLDLVRHVAGLRSRTAVALLQKAVDRQCLREDDRGGVSFVQELLRRAIYAKLGPNARATLHRLAAEQLEGDGLLASAAYHYAKAGRRDDAVRTALAAASGAEYSGAYSTAVELYRLALETEPPHASDIALRLAEAHLVLGERDEAATVLGGLDEDMATVRLLRAKLIFSEGNVDGALEETERVLPMLAAGQLDARIWLAGLYLYRGRLDVARQHAEAALREAGDGDPALLARCEGIVGAAKFFAGDLDGGEASFLAAATRLSAIPTEQRDRFVYTTILGNLGQAREARGDWAGARRFHEEALASRRAVSDARGALQSLHAMARTAIGSGSFDEARPLLEEARHLATRLGDSLELAKLEHTAGQLALATGDAKEAIRSMSEALDRFRERRVDYDAAHARFSLAAAYAAGGRPRRSVEEGATARVEAQGHGFGLLATLYPALGFSYRDAIATRLRSIGGTEAVMQFGALLGTDRDADISGTLPAALSGSRPADAMSLALLVGWATPLDAVAQRRELALSVARGIGADAEAAAAALIVAACASWALEQASPALLLQVAQEEAPAAVATTGADERIARDLASVASGQWRPGQAAIGAGPPELLTRALWWIAAGEPLEGAPGASIGAGGTALAALVGGLVGSDLAPDGTRPRTLDEPGRSAPAASDGHGLAQLDSIAAGIATRRIGRRGG